jgi:hypothetical protein
VVTVSVLNKFTIDGKESGTIILPCNGVTSVIMKYIIKAKLDQGENAAHVKIWIGERSWWNTDLVKDTIMFVGAPGIWLERTLEYNLKCDGSCKLTPSGRGAAMYNTDGKKLDIRAGHYKLGVIWYSKNHVTVKCSSDASSVGYDSAVSLDSEFTERDEMELAEKISIEGNENMTISKHGKIIYNPVE